MPPKNNISKSTAKSKSTARRKPLQDVYNSVNLPFKSTGTTKISKSFKVEEERVVRDDENGALDRLLLIHSDLSSLIHQIDELVVQALNSTSRKSTKEVESFANVLSQMQSSLKPWIPRFQKALSNLPSGPENQLQQSRAVSEIAPMNKTVKNVESPEETTMDSLVSPSPLVSWRADCNIERGRQLFLLTPLPRPKELTSKYQEKSKSVLENVTSRNSILPPSTIDIEGLTNDNPLQDISIKPTPNKTSDCNLASKCVSPENFSKTGSCMAVMTPCLKISPPKSCILLEPISEFTQKRGHAVYRSTPFPVGAQISEVSESSSSQDSERTSVKYTDFLGIKLGQNYVRRKGVEESPNWLLSPPKTCVLMEPPEEDKILTNAPNDEPLPKEASSVLHKGKNLLSEMENDVQGDQFIKTACKQGHDISSVMVECTPLLKEPESTIRRGGVHPGENTLKKELWTKFEAASTNGISFSVPFLDKLDEVSS